MATSAISIANQAIIGLRGSLINSFEDNTLEARACKLHWDPVRQAELERHPWNFAIKRATLARLADAPTFGYAYQYQLPADHLRTLRVEGSIDFREEGGRILTNEKRVQIKYVYDNKDVITWSENFANLVTARLRLELAYTLAADKNMIQLSNDLYNKRSMEAKYIDSSADPGDTFSQETPNLIKVRY